MTAEMTERQPSPPQQLTLASCTTVHCTLSPTPVPRAVAVAPAPVTGHRPADIALQPGQRDVIWDSDVRMVAVWPQADVRRSTCRWRVLHQSLHDLLMLLLLL